MEPHVYVQRWAIQAVPVRSAQKWNALLVFWKKEAFGKDLRIHIQNRAGSLHVCCFGRVSIQFRKTRDCARAETPKLLSRIFVPSTELNRQNRDVAGTPISLLSNPSLHPIWISLVDDIESTVLRMNLFPAMTTVASRVEKMPPKVDLIMLPVRGQFWN